jgi:xanthine dehydrogenase YagR molybdenum-binding subunit
LPLDRINVQLGDTKLGRCGTTGGSALTASTAPAIKDAAAALRTQLLALAARAPDGFPGADQHPDELEFVNGRIAHRGSAKSISYRELLAFGKRDALEAEVTSPVVFGENDKYAIHSVGAVFVEVRVDRMIGRVRVSRVVGVYDVGKVLNTATTRSQLIGGVVWGIGQALLEGLYYDPNKGMPLNPDLAGYLVPVHADMPSNIDVSWLDIPDYNFNSLGCRGTGEISITGVAPAIANAVYHATGIRVRDLPIAPEALL